MELQIKYYGKKFTLEVSDDITSYELVSDFMSMMVMLGFNPKSVQDAFNKCYNKDMGFIKKITNVGLVRQAASENVLVGNQEPSSPIKFQFVDDNNDRKT